MKKYLFPLLAAFALMAGVANAQAPAPGQDGGRPSPEQMAAHQSERMTKELGLSPEQTTKVQQIMTARDQERQAMHGQLPSGTSRKQMHEQMQANQTKYDAQFKEVLTPEQYTKYSAMQAEHKGHKGHKGHGGPNAEGGDKKGKVKIKKDKLKVKAE